MTDIVSSRDNPSIKQLMGLFTQKKQRDEQNMFAIEGVKLCFDAFKAGLLLETLFVTVNAFERNSVVDTLINNSKKTIWISDNLSEKISETKSPQGIFCIFNKPDNSLTDENIKTDGRYIFLSNIQDPGNLGTVLRTAFALSLDGAIVANCPDLYSPKVLRSAMGAVFSLPIMSASDDVATVKELVSIGLTVIAAALSETIPLKQTELSKKGSVVVIGNEGAGLSSELIAACSGSVIIPMNSQAQSLNASAAAAILIWEMVRQDLSENLQA